MVTVKVVAANRPLPPPAQIPPVLPLHQISNAKGGVEDIAQPSGCDDGADADRQPGRGSYGQ